MNTFEIKKEGSMKNELPISIVKMQNNVLVERIDSYDYMETMTNTKKEPHYHIENEQYGISFQHPMEKNKGMVFGISQSTATLLQQPSQKLLFNVFSDTINSTSELTMETEDELFKKCIRIRDDGIAILKKPMEAIVDIIRFELNTPHMDIKRHLCPDTKKTKYATDRFKYLTEREGELLQTYMDAFRHYLVNEATISDLIDVLVQLYSIKLDIVNFVNATLLCPFCGLHGHLLHFTYFKTKSNWKKHLRKLCNHKPMVFEELQMPLIELMIKATSANDLPHDTWVYDALQSEMNRHSQQRMGMIRWCFERLNCRNPFVICKTLSLLMQTIELNSSDSLLPTQRSQLEQLTNVTGFGHTQNNRVHSMANTLLSRLKFESHSFVSGNHIEKLEICLDTPENPYNTMDKKQKVQDRLRSKVNSVRQFINSKIRTEEPLKQYLLGNSMFSSFQRALSTTASSTLSSWSHYLNQHLLHASTSPDTLDRMLSAIDELIKTEPGFHYFQHHSDSLEQLHVSSKAHDILATLKGVQEDLKLEESVLMSDDDDETLLHFDFDDTSNEPLSPPLFEHYPSLDDVLSTSVDPFSVDPFY